MAPMPRFKNPAGLKSNTTRKIEIKEPQSAAEVAMNPSKLREIRAALETSDNTRLVILSGPAGCSKSTAVKAICRDIGRPLKEYAEPRSGNLDAFGDFLVGCTLIDQRTIIFVDELPNLSHGDTLEKFKDAVDYWLQLENAPLLVIVFTEIEFGTSYGDMIVVSRIFGDMLSNEHVRHIKCLPISPSFIKRCLKQYTSDSGLLDSLSELGDIRQALYGLDQNSLNAGSIRDLKVNIFHRIGQVAWGSKNVDPTVFLDEQEYNETFDNHLFENYAQASGHSVEITEFAKCSDYLSLGDAFNLRLAPYALHMYFKSAPSGPGRFQKMHLSQMYRKLRSKHEVFAKSSLEFAYVRAHASVSMRDILADHSLGLKNERPHPEILLSDSDFSD